MFERIEKHVETSLNFHPNCPNNTVRVKLGYWGKSLNNVDEYYVLVSGNDDTMLQTEELSFEDALKIYDSIEEMGSKECKYFVGSSNNNGFPSILHR